MNDLVYNEIVATPGFELEFAIGTTYSLDAEAFLAITLSFARLGDVTDADFRSPFRLLEGLRQANKKVAIFCNRGGLHPPTSSNPLYAMLDQSVFEVSDERKGHELSNFHPKIWIIKERATNNHNYQQIKLIVMSRNLTKDTSLDVAATMIAPLRVKTSAELRHKHQPLKDLLLILAEKANPDKKKKIRLLANELASMGKFVLEPPYEDYDFLPIHFGESLNPQIDIKEDLAGQKMMIVSPFIDKQTIDSRGNETPIKWLNSYKPSAEKILVTRLDSLTPEIMKLYSSDKREVWIMSQIAEQNDIQSMPLHAKMYFSWAPKTKPDGIYYWLGSANATNNGFNRNAEFLLRLTMSIGRGRFEDFKAEFCDEKKQLCERITSIPQIEMTKENHTLEVAIRKNLISRNNLSAEVFEIDGSYKVIISAKKLIGISGKVTFTPIQESWNEAELSSVELTCNIKISSQAHLSEFYILKVTPFNNSLEPVKMAIRIPTKGIPTDRDNCIFRTVIDTQDKFLNYVEFIIANRSQELASLIMQRDQVVNNKTSGLTAYQRNKLYESLLRIVATNPERLEDIQDLISHLNVDVIPNSFRQMADIFKRSIKKRR